MRFASNSPYRDFNFGVPKYTPMSFQAPTFSPSGQQPQAPIGVPRTNLGAMQSPSPQPMVGVPKINPDVIRKAAQQKISKADLITHNLKGGKRNVKGIRRDLLNLMEHNPGIIGLQETGNKERTKIIRRILKNNGYGVSGKGNTPIAFNKDQYRMIDKGSRKISDRTFVGERGAGPSTLKAKRANYMVLKQKGGGPRRAITNLHLAPSRQFANRRKLSNQQMQNTAALQKELARLFPNAKRTVIGDLNVGKKGALGAFRKAGLRTPQSKKKTHRVGTPDWIMSQGGVKGLRTFNTGSDHDALMANFRRR